MYEQYDVADVLEQLTDRIISKNDKVDYVESKEVRDKVSLTDKEKKKNPRNSLISINKHTRLIEGKMESLHIIHLPIWEDKEDKKDKVLLSSYLKQFLKRENKNDTMIYNGTKERRKATHTIAYGEISKEYLPSMMVFRRRLLNYNPKTGYNYVAPTLIYPKEFNIGEETYKCTAEVFHAREGGEGGHYTSKTGDWYRDDDLVLEAKKAKVKGNVSILVYERQGNNGFKDPELTTNNLIKSIQKGEKNHYKQRIK